MVLFMLVDLQSQCVGQVLGMAFKKSSYGEWLQRGKPWTYV